MSDHLKRALDKQSRELAGPPPVEQHIILLKLSDLMANMPDLSVESPPGELNQRQWIAEIGALVSRVSLDRRMNFGSARSMLTTFWSTGVSQIQGVALDVIEELKLDLEISGQADIGSAYAPGDVYQYFADLKSIVDGADSELFIIDPYFDGEAFNNYLSEIGSGIGVRIFANKHAQEVKAYIEKHKAQFQSAMEVRKNKQLHDRLVIVDRTDCWITGGSINHGGKKSPSYLIPIGSELTRDKLGIYEALWGSSRKPNSE